MSWEPGAIKGCAEPVWTESGLPQLAVSGSMKLVSALDARSGVVSVVGAGGKKSTMYRLAEAIDRAVVTATVRIPPFESHVARVVVTDDPVRTILDASEDDWPLGLVPKIEREDRYLGYATELIDSMAEIEPVDTILVKADGARLRKFKAPDQREPQVPASSTVVVPVVSAHVIGQPLSDELVHRVDRVATLTGLSPGQIMTPEAVAAVLSSPDGGHKGVPDGATVIPLINMVDDDGLYRRARQVADSLLSHRAYRRVILTQLTAEQPVVEVVE